MRLAERPACSGLAAQRPPPPLRFTRPGEVVVDAVLSAFHVGRALQVAGVPAVLVTRYPAFTPRLQAPSELAVTLVADVEQLRGGYDGLDVRRVVLVAAFLPRGAAIFSV